MLTVEEAIRFLVQELQITNVESKLQNDRAALVNEMLLSFLHHLPFNNIEHMSVPVGQRGIPSEEEGHARCWDGAGGLCWNLNTFFYRMLQALGYDVYSVLSSVTRIGSNGHTAMVIRDLVKPGDLYLCDVGFGYPTFQVIPLDFEKESPIYRNSYNTYKFIKDGDQYIRLHETRKDRQQYVTVVETRWAHAYYFKLDPVELAELKCIMHKSVYTNMQSKFNQILTICIFRKGRAVALRNNTLLLEDDGGNLVVNKLKTDEEMVRVIQKYVPAIPIDTARRAIKNWHDINGH